MRETRAQTFPLMCKPEQGLAQQNDSVAYVGIMAVSQQGKNLDSDFTLLYTNYVQKVCPEQPHILEIFELIGIYINVLLKSLRYAVFESIGIHRNIKSPQQGYEMQPVME